MRRNIGPIEQDRRLSAFEAFTNFWFHEQGQTFEQLAARGPRSVDAALVSYAQSLFADGAARHHFLHALLAAQDAESLQGQLRRAWDVNHTWEALTPGSNNVPLNILVWRAFVCLALVWGWIDFAVLLLIAFPAMLRVSEMTKLSVQDLLLPEHWGGLFQYIMVIVHDPKNKRFYAR